MSTIGQINKFFEIAVPNPTHRNGAVQLGCVFEEFYELLEATGWDSSELGFQLKHAAEYQMTQVSAVGNETTDIDKLLLADSAADIIVTLVGYCRIHGINLEGALKEVAASNLSKFYHVGVGDLDISELDNLCKRIEADGRYKGVYWERVGDYCIFFDENKKILKNPKTYFEPNLSPFVKVLDRQ